MSTFFDTIKRSYEDVEITDNGINTVQFLEASESLVSLFGTQDYCHLLMCRSAWIGSLCCRQEWHEWQHQSALLCSVAYYRKFVIERSVIPHNLPHCKNWQPTRQTKRSLSQQREWCGFSGNRSMKPCWWRGLSFTSIALRRSVTDPAEELSDSFNKAYDVTLKKYHSFVVRPVFGVGALHIPYWRSACNESMSISCRFFQEIRRRSK